MTTIERVCLILERVALNPSISFGDLSKSTGIDHWILMGDVKALREVDFLEISPSGYPAGLHAGPRLRLVVDNVRAQP